MGVEAVYGNADRGQSCVLISFHFCGSSVIVSGANEERAALWIDRGWLPNRAAAVSPWLSAIVRHVEGFPKHRTGFLIERDDTAAKTDRKSTRLNSSHTVISYAVFCLKKKKNKYRNTRKTTL